MIVHAMILRDKVVRSRLDQPIPNRPCQTESDLSESVGKSRFKSSVRSDFYITHKDDSRSILELPLWLGGVRNLPKFQGSGLGAALAVVETLEVSGA
jgi:hypothetical protein